MPRKCKCKICKKELTTDKAFMVLDTKNKKHYYCTQEEYEEELEEINSKNKCYETISTIMNIPFVTPMMKKELKKIRKYYIYPVIERTFKDNSDSIQWFLNNKASDNEYGNMRYIISIILNNIQKTAKIYKKEQEEMKKLFESDKNTEDSISIMNDLDNKKQIDRNVSDISEFLDD